MTGVPFRAVIASAAALGVAACAGGSGSGDAASAPRDTTTGAPARIVTANAAPLNDAGIVVLATHINNAEIAAAQLASPKLQNLDARAFATAMAAEHVALNGALDSLSVKKDTLSQPPAQFATMRQASDTLAERLVRTPSGYAFDQVYVTSQVAAHEQAADSLTRWQQAARDPGLKAALGAALPRVQGHLARARALETALRVAPDSASVPPPPPDTGGATRVQRPAGPALETVRPAGTTRPDTTRLAADTMRPSADTTGRRSGAAFSRADSARARADSARSRGHVRRGSPYALGVGAGAAGAGCGAAPSAAGASRIVGSPTIS